MPSLSFDLKRFRVEKLKVTQTKMAEALGLRQDALSRYENHPEEIPFKVIQAISEKYGVNYNELLNYQKKLPEALKIKNTWTSIESLKNTLSEYLMNRRTNYAIVEEKRIDDLYCLIQKLTAKPKVVFLGRSDSGKSTLINALLGKEQLPTSWAPATSIIVYLKHIDDRPSYIKDNVWVFKKDQNNSYWEDSRINDESYTSSLKVAEGSSELLSSYGTSEGKQYQNSIGSAVVFLDSPVLKTCDFVDVPGFTGGRPSDNDAALYASKKTDVLVFLSQANSFMGIEDAVYLKKSIEQLPVLEGKKNFTVLSNLFVVATQAHVINNGDEKEIKHILDCGSERFCRTLPENYWTTRTNKNDISEYSQENIRKRFFSYTTDSFSLRNDFENAFRKTLESLPTLMLSKIQKALESYRDELKEEISNAISHNKSLLEQLHNLKEQLKIREMNLDHTLCELNEQKSMVLKEIRKSQQNAWNSFEKAFHSLVNSEKIISLITERNIKNRKASKEEFVAYFSSLLDTEFSEANRLESNRINQILEEAYCKNCEKVFANFSSISSKTSQNSYITTYNVKRTFIAGLSGAASFGALAVWASACGNLGGYIIVAKIVGILSALGIHIGGTAAAIGTVSALGGPVTWGIGIAAILSLSVFALIGAGWKKALAKNICAEINTQNVIQDFKEENHRFWKDTEDAFCKGHKAVEDGWIHETEQLRSDIENYNPQLIRNKIKQLNNLYQIIDHLPIYD